MSISHLVLLFLILLIIFGPTRLEGIGVSLGKAIRGFKKGMEEGSTAETEQKTEQKNDAPTPTTQA
ncbi:MAG: twin-arginine translocase TatA/TatE family subunit [Bdellovibrionota bacterium]